MNPIYYFIYRILNFSASKYILNLNIELKLKISRRSAPNLTSMIAIDLDQTELENGLADELTAEIDLSDPAHVSGLGNDDDGDDLGVTPISSLTGSVEGTPMICCTPRSNSRVVRIISKQSNV